MSIEELKLILETVQGVSDSAVWVAILYFVVGTLKYVLGVGVLYALVYGTYKLIRRGLTQHSESTFTMSIINAAGTYWPISPRMVNKIIAVIKEAKEAGRFREGGF